ncbi:hypothetical protein K1719_032546 [Acacia pycnantha]|nr:hypothetical protein K1719_032546 [Acacia pycnantha]
MEPFLNFMNKIIILMGLIGKKHIVIKKPSEGLTPHAAVAEPHLCMWVDPFLCWLTTNDRVLKDALMFYARLQLNLLRSVNDGCSLLEQLLDVVCKDLDQGCMSSSSIPWSAAFCSLTRNYHSRISKDLFLYWFEGIWMIFDSAAICIPICH